jgi:hypothetical protein
MPRGGGGFTRKDRVSYNLTRLRHYLYMPILQDLPIGYLLDCLGNGPLAWILRPSGLSHGRLPYSFSPSPIGVVLMVPNLVSSPRVLGE